MHGTNEAEIQALIAAALKLEHDDMRNRGAIWSRIRLLVTPQRWAQIAHDDFQVSVRQANAVIRAYAICQHYKLPATVPASVVIRLAELRDDLRAPFIARLQGGERVRRAEIDAAIRITRTAPDCRFPRLARHDSAAAAPYDSDVESSALARAVRFYAVGGAAGIAQRCSRRSAQ